MGVTQVTVLIRNPAEPDRTWEGLFLVDTDAIDSLVPRPQLEAIGLKPKGQRVCGLADGSEVRLDITTAGIEFMGEIIGGTIVFGAEDAEGDGVVAWHDRDCKSGNGCHAVVNEVINGGGMEQAATLGWFAEYCV